MLSLVINQRTDLAAFSADNENVTTLERATLDQHGRNSAAALVQLRFNHNGFGSTVRVRFEFHHFGLQRELFKQGIKAGFLER